MSMLDSERFLRSVVVAIIFFAIPIICVVLACIYGLDYEIPMGEIGGGFQSIRNLAPFLLFWIGVGVLVLRKWLAAEPDAEMDSSRPLSKSFCIVSIGLVVLFILAVFILSAQ